MQSDPIQPVSPSGVLVLDKPLGATSRAMCTLVRTRLRRGGAPKRVKVGHAGTLDPLATGVLVILVGRCTRLCDSLMAGQKRYLTTIDLGHVSKSHDLELEPEEVPVERVPTTDDIERACSAMVGVISQTPPMHSAIKINGRRAYQLARKGDEPKMQPRPVRIDSIDVLGYDFPRLRLDIRCGKGVYIRSLARDLGVALGVGGMLHELRRTLVAPFAIERAVRAEDLPEAMGQGDLIAVDLSPPGPDALPGSPR